MFLPVWFWAGFVTLFLNDVICDDGRHRVQRSSPGRGSGGRSCGDGLCWCGDNGQEAQCLDIGGNVTTLPRLPQSVRVLELSFDNSFRNLTNGIFFYNASHITSLHLLSGNMQRLNNESFVWATNLTLLNIEYDFVRGMDTLTTTPMDLIAPLFTIQTLRFLNASDCVLQYTANKTFHAIGDSNIEILHLERNFFKDIVNLGQYEVFKRLKQLYLSYNGIFFVKSDRIFGIKELFLDNNWIGLFPETCKGNHSLYPKLEMLNLNHNSITYLQASVCLPRLKTLWLEYNQVVSIPANTFSDAHFPFLTQLHTTRILPPKRPDVFSIQRCAFCNTNLTVLTLAMMNIDFTRTDQIDTTLFADLPNLRTLQLDYNNFSNMNDSLFVQLFSGLNSLTELSLSNCNFSTFTSVTFVIFPNLSMLNLRENGIMELPDAIFEPLSNLRILDLSQNKFATISEKLFSPQTQQSLLQLSFHDNPIQCSCELMWFSKWMVRNLTVFGYPADNYDCRNLPDIDIPEYSLKEHACLLTREVNILIIFSISLVMISLTSFSMVYLYRWHIRMLLYELFRGRHNARRERLLADHFDYDVFVSYASEDLPWVRRHLMPMLENNMGLKLCVHERDFIPGKNILENIADCVQSSKKILVVYSNNFVGSQWCQFELTYCLQHVMDYDDALIIVCLDDVPSRRMTSAMMAVLKTTTYIQWAEQEDAVHSFWRRLRVAVQEIMQQNVHV